MLHYLDGTKIKANASQHQAMSGEYSNEEQLQREVAELLKRAETENHKGSPNIDKSDIPAEIQLSCERLSKITKVFAAIEKRAQARYKQEKAEDDTKMVERTAKETERGRKLGGRKPKAPEPGPRAKDQVNFTDEDSRIRPKSGGGFIQGYNAPASLDIETMLIVGQHISPNPNDKQEVEPVRVELDKLPEELGTVSRSALDKGYFSADKVEKVIKQQIEPYLASGRQSHNQSLEERFAEPTEAPKNAKPVEAMQYRMKTTEGKKFVAQSKSTVEPVFGLIKEIMGFGHFRRRGLEAVKGSFPLVCIAFHLKRLCVLNAWK